MWSTRGRSIFWSVLFFMRKAGSAFDQSRVSTKCPQEGNGVKLST